MKTLSNYLKSNLYYVIGNVILISTALTIVIAFAFFNNGNFIAHPMF